MIGTCSSRVHRNKLCQRVCCMTCAQRGCGFSVRTVPPTRFSRLPRSRTMRSHPWNLGWPGRLVRIASAAVHPKSARSRGSMRTCAGRSSPPRGGRGPGDSLRALSLISRSRGRPAEAAPAARVGPHLVNAYCFTPPHPPSRRPAEVPGQKGATGRCRDLSRRPGSAVERRMESLFRAASFVTPSDTHGIDPSEI